jgi:hypothetical protein
MLPGLASQVIRVSLHVENAVRDIPYAHLQFDGRKVVHSQPRVQVLPAKWDTGIRYL